MENVETTTIKFTPDQLLNHWQGHRNLTRNVIKAFPEDKLFNYTIGGMRSFADLARELIGVAAMGIHGIATEEWLQPAEFNYQSKTSPLVAVRTKDDLLDFWDRATEKINTTWPQIPEARFYEQVALFGMYEGHVWSHLFYFIDNENHHRGQGYVYLRSLDIEPPYFWDR